MDVMLNGEARTIPDGVTVAQLLQQLNIQPERVAVEVNLTVLKRAQLPDVSLRPGDQVEIVQLIGGGSENKAASFKPHAASFSGLNAWSLRREANNDG